MSDEPKMSNAEFIKSIYSSVGDYWEETANLYLREALDRLEAAEARVKELEAEHGPLKCAKMLPPKTRPDFYVEPEDK